MFCSVSKISQCIIILFVYRTEAHNIIILYGEQARLTVLTHTRDLSRVILKRTINLYLKHWLCVCLFYFYFLTRLYFKTNITVFGCRYIKQDFYLNKNNGKNQERVYSDTARKSKSIAIRRRRRPIL